LKLIVTADDFGLHPAYDRGILEAATAGAIDAASVMVLRSPARIEDLAASGVALGLHAEAREPGGALEEAALLEQLRTFERLVGRRPDYLDGHHHCHAVGSAAGLVAWVAGEGDLPVRSVGPEHRRLLRDAEVRTADLLVGRHEENQPVIPADLHDPPPGIRSIEWMTHPGHPDPSSGSSYDRGRGEDLAALLSFELPPGFARGTHLDLERD